MSEYLDYPEFKVKIKRTSRKNSTALTVRDQEVVVLAPRRLKHKHILGFVEEKKAWIMDKLSREIPPLQFIDGEKLSYFGHQIRLSINYSDKSSITLSDDCLHIAINKSIASSELIKKKCSLFFRKKAQQYLIKRCHELANAFAFYPKDISVKSFKARWGSCTVEQQIQLNWKLIFTPKHVIDYVIIHELCHLVHFNHSPLFWQAVAACCPQYKHCISWLKQNASLIRHW
jgi:predicted metal-dependent hydrolase